MHLKSCIFCNGIYRLNVYKWWTMLYQTSHTENEEQCTNRMSTSTAINKNHNIYQSTTVQSIDLLDQH